MKSRGDVRLEEFEIKEDTFAIPTFGSIDQDSKRNKADEISRSCLASVTNPHGDGFMQMLQDLSNVDTGGAIEEETEEQRVLAELKKKNPDALTVTEIQRKQIAESRQRKKRNRVLGRSDSDDEKEDMEEEMIRPVPYVTPVIFSHPTFGTSRANLPQKTAVSCERMPAVPGMGPRLARLDLRKPPADYLSPPPTRKNTEYYAGATEIDIGKSGMLSEWNFREPREVPVEEWGPNGGKMGRVPRGVHFHSDKHGTECEAHTRTDKGVLESKASHGLIRLGENEFYARKGKVSSEMQTAQPGQESVTDFVGSPLQQARALGRSLGVNESGQWKAGGSGSYGGSSSAGGGSRLVSARGRDPTADRHEHLLEQQRSLW